MDQIDIEKYFERRFVFTVESALLVPKTAYNSSKWSISSLQEKKKALNAVKEQLSNFCLADWSQYTKSREPSGLIMPYLRRTFKPDLLTQAWCKFFECLSQFDVIPKPAIENGHFASLHICEAPGAFICALNHYLASNHTSLKWDWLANTLNPDYEGNPASHMIPDDRLIRHTSNKWVFGRDFSGNIKNYYFYEDITRETAKLGQVWLVTADGSVDCMQDPGEQEATVEDLHYCEVIIALATLCVGGTLVLKMFTMFEEGTICMLYLLNLVFETVNVFKPATSKSGNSEVYLICLEYKGTDVISHLWKTLLDAYKSESIRHKFSMFALNEINNDFLQQVELCAHYFMQKQICKINENVSHFQQESHSDHKQVKYIRNKVLEYYITKYNIKKISPNKKIIQNLKQGFFMKQVLYKPSWIYHAQFTELTVTKDLLISNADSLINIITGKAVEKVLYSNFCSKDYADLYSDFFINAFSPVSDSIIGDITITLLGSTGVLDAQKLTFSKLSEFHLELFRKFKTESEKDNIIIKQVPFLTCLSVGLLYLVMLQYKKVIFHKSGFIVLQTKSLERMQNIQNCFQKIDDAYTDLLKMDDMDFRYDVMQVVPLNVVLDSPFGNVIWNYNNALYE